MDTQGNTGNFRGSKIGEIVIPTGEDDDVGYPNVPGVFLQNGVWLVSMLFNGKRKRLSCGAGIEGYRTAVELKVEFERKKRKKKMLEMFKKI